jgi:hypothetical protein
LPFSWRGRHFLRLCRATRYKRNRMFSNSATPIFFSGLSVALQDPLFRQSYTLLLLRFFITFIFSIDVIITLRTKTITTIDERRRTNGKAQFLSFLFITCSRLTTAFYIFHFSFDFRSAKTITTTIAMTTTLMTTRSLF